MKPIIIIPARYNSSRFPGKMLHQMNGQSLIFWTALQATLTGYDVVVATDDERIAEAVQSLPCDIVMTSPECRNGTERVAEAWETLGDEYGDEWLEQYDCVINWQGDNPLMPRRYVEVMMEALEYAPRDFDMITPYIEFSHEDAKVLVEKRKRDVVGGTTVVTDTSGNALYFSKEVIPHMKDIENVYSTPIKYHVGAYLYNPAALLSYSLIAETDLEQEEGLEQLRFLEAGMQINCVQVPHTGVLYNEVNNLEDVAPVEEALKNGEYDI